MIAGESADLRTARDRASNLTHVELTWLEKRIEHWIRFGRIAEERMLTRSTRIVSFAPGHVFAFVRWASNDFGTIISRIDILRAVTPGEPYSTLPFVRPGGEILLRIVGWPNVSRVLSAIDQVDAVGVDPIDAAPDHWRHVHNRLTAGGEPRPYTSARHNAGSCAGASRREPTFWHAGHCCTDRFPWPRSAPRSTLVDLERERERAHRPLRDRAAD